MVMVNGPSQSGGISIVTAFIHIELIMIMITWKFAVVQILQIWFGFRTDSGFDF